MALVDYSSSSAASDSADDDPHPPEPKRRKGDEAGAGGAADGDVSITTRAATSASSSVKTSTKSASRTAHSSSDLFSATQTKTPSDMPPLPSAFHDMYASNARQSIVDDPSLHQGRKRQTPHVAGKWPSHVYVEWHPALEQHDTLVKLVDQVRAELGHSVKLHDFLSSDLGAPLPLHISLSRPLTLSTANKDGFLERITGSIRSGGTRAFAVRPCGLAWYRSPDSDRAFLILRVADEPVAPSDLSTPNEALMALLKRCNTVAALFGQRTLYQETRGEPVGSAFHVSIGWTLGLPSINGAINGQAGGASETDDGKDEGYLGRVDEETCLRALRSFRRDEFADARSWDVPVAGIKVKIGNIVSHLPLPGAPSADPRGLFAK